MSSAEKIALEREFTRLVEEHRGIIFKVIRLYVNHEEDEQDLFQEILFQAWRTFPQFRRESKFSTWLYRVGLNTVLTFRRRPALVTPHEDLTTLHHPTGDETMADQAEALYVAIRELGEVDRMVISLHLDGYSNEEIGDIAGITKNNVGVKLHRIREGLMTKLKAI